MLEKIKKWYKLGLWSADMVCKAGVKGLLSQAQLQEVLGQ